MKYCLICEEWFWFADSLDAHYEYEHKQKAQIERMTYSMRKGKGVKPIWML